MRYHLFLLLLWMLLQWYIIFESFFIYRFSILINLCHIESLGCSLCNGYFNLCCHTGAAIQIQWNNILSHILWKFCTFIIIENTCIECLVAVLCLTCAVFKQFGNAQNTLFVETIREFHKAVIKVNCLTSVRSFYCNTVSICKLCYIYCSCNNTSQIANAVFCTFTYIIGLVRFHTLKCNCFGSGILKCKCFILLFRFLLLLLLQFQLQHLLLPVH